MSKIKEYRKLALEAQQAQQDGDVELLQEAMRKIKAFEVFNQDYITSLRNFMIAIAGL